MQHYVSKSHCSHAVGAESAVLNAEVQWCTRQVGFCPRGDTPRFRGSHQFCVIPEPNRWAKWSEKTVQTAGPSNLFLKFEGFKAILSAIPSAGGGQVPGTLRVTWDWARGRTRQLSTSRHGWLGEIHRKDFLEFWLLDSTTTTNMLCYLVLSSLLTDKTLQPLAFDIPIIFISQVGHTLGTSSTSGEQWQVGASCLRTSFTFFV